MAVQFASTSSSNRFETESGGAELHPVGERTIAVWCQPNDVSQVWKVLSGEGGSADDWSLEFYNGSLRYIVGTSNQYAGYGIPVGWNLVVLRGIPGSKNFTSQIWQPGTTGSPSRSTIDRPPEGWSPDGILIAGDTYANPLGDVGVWDVILTDSQAAQLAAGARFDSIFSKPIHYWPFYESSSTVEDAAGSNDMVLVGSAPSDVEHPYVPTEPEPEGGVLPFLSSTVQHTDSSASFTTGSISAPSNGVLIAVITTRSVPPVTDVSGLGATWVLAHTQAAARDQIKQEIWIGEGASGSGGVSITLAGAENSATQIMAVDDVDGWATDVAVTNGTDDTSPNVTAVVENSNSLVITCASDRNAVYSVGAGQTENVINVLSGDGGAAARTSTAFIEGVSDDVALPGTYSFAVDWVQGAVVLWGAAAGPQGYAAVVLADNPVGYYRLGEPDNSPVVQDISGNNVHGIYTNPGGSTPTDGPMPDSVGRRKDHASAYADMPISVSENPGGYTFEIWIRLDASQSGTNNYMLSESDSANAGTTIRQSTGDTISVWHKNASAALRILSGGTYVIGQWHHIVITYDGSMFRLYVDGNLEGSVSEATTFVASNRFTRIFGGTHTTMSYTDISMADLAIYDYPLTAQQISYHFDARVLSSPPPDPLDIPNRYEDDDPKLLFEGVWGNAAHSSRSGGSAKYTDSPHSKVSLNFTGDTLNVIATKDSGRGLASVKIDGVEHGPIDYYSPSLQWQQPVFSVTDLDDGEHTAIIECLGQIGQGSTIRIEIDAIEVYELLDPPERPPMFQQDDSRIQLIAFGDPVEGGNYYGGTGHTTWGTNAYAWARIMGDSLRIYSLVGPSRGTSEVIIDGVSIDTFSTYHEYWGFQSMVYEKTGLGPGPHSLIIVHRSGGLTLDAIMVEDLIDEGLTRYEETDPLISAPEWTPITHQNYSAGSGITKYTHPASVSFWIDGPKLRIIGAMGEERGTAEVWVDGTLYAEVDTQAPVWHFQWPVFEAWDLGDGPHYIEWRNKQDNAVTFDAVEAEALILPPPPEFGDFMVRRNDEWVEAFPLRKRNDDNTGWEPALL